MSTSPNGFQTPKTNWQPSDPIGVSDLNRIEGNTNAIETGSRTLDPSQAPTGNVGTLRQLLDWFANRSKAIMGTTNWYDVPATTLAAAKAHMDAAAPHSGHETPAGAQAKVDAHAALTSAHGATSAATAGRIIIRDSAGRAQVADPAAAQDIATRAYVDGWALGWVEPDDAILVEAPAELYTVITTKELMKRFQVKSPGNYRVTFEVRTTGGTGYYQVDAQDPVGNAMWSYGGNITSTSYYEVTLDVPAAPTALQPGSYVAIYLGNPDGHATYIQNARLRGKLGKTSPRALVG